MIDFDKAEERLNQFGGSEKKTTVLYNGQRYMIKYPDPVRGGRFKGEISYKNNQFSEHIGCQIFKACGFQVQDTLLGYYTDKGTGKRKLVVACKDFTQDGSHLYEFKDIANQALVDKAKVNLNIEEVYAVIHDVPLIKNKQEMIDGFWDMFVIDALIGNRDRHLGNWGVLEAGDVLTFAPIYDCGSSLSAMLDDDAMEDGLKHAGAFKQNAYNITSCYHLDGKRIFYHEIFKNPPDDLKAAIKRVVPRIDMAKIHAIIDETPVMSDMRKQYLKQALELRCREILAPALQRELRESH